MVLSIRRALVLAFTGIVVAITVVLFTLSVIQRDRLVRDLAPLVLGRAQLHADAELQRLFGTISARLAAHRRQIRMGLLPLGQAGALKDQLLPDAYQLPAVGSAMVGDTSGYQLLVMRYDSLVTRSPLLAGRTDLPRPRPEAVQYFTREFRASQWGDRSEWSLWDPVGRRIEQTWQQPLPGYDPRTREWMLRAVSRFRQLEAAGGSADPEDYVAWTDAYTLFTSKTPGISASVAARDPQGRLEVAAYDLLLDDLTHFVRAQRPTRHGRVFVLSDSGRVVGLPEAAGPSSERARLAALLRPLETVGDPELAAWAQAWRHRTSDSPAPFRFRAAGANHWGSFRPFPLGADRRLWIGVSVPERDLLATTSHDPVIILLIALIALGAGLLLAAWFATQLSRPLVQLLRRSRRIAALRFESEDTPRSMLREVRDLDETFRSMGESLHEHLAALEEAREELARSEERFRSTFEQAAVGICHVTPEGRLLRVNQRMCEIVGYSREQLLDRHFAEITHPESLEEDRDRIAGILAGRDDIISWEKRYVHRTGATVWVEVTPHLLRDAHGQPLYFITAVQDITARRALEDQLRQSQKLEAVGQLAGGVAHDFNNLLTVIEGHAALAERALPAGHPARADLEQVGAASRRAAELTRHLLAFARREIIEPRVLHPRGLVEESQQMLRRLIGERIGLDVDVPSSLPWIRIDRGQFEQVLVNLVVNARDAMPQGGRISIGAGEVTVPADAEDRFHGAPAGRHVEFRVADTGTGIPAQARPHIFEPFFTTKQPGQGTGLGLSTCFGIVRQAGGQMWFESAEGAGTTFHVLLPAAPAPLPDAASEPLPPAEGSGREVILLVEDEPAIRTIAERGLRGLGYQVHSAGDGAEATVRADELGDTVDLLVTDVIMPGILGRDLAEGLVARFPRMKVLFVSGYGRDNLEGQLSEGTHFLAKPFGPGELAEKVRAVLDGTD